MASSFRLAKPAYLALSSVVNVRKGRVLSTALVRTLCFASGELKQPPKAAAIIIGNEVLSGKIQDTNTATLAKLLYSRGVDLVRAEIIPDVKQDIGDTVLKLSEMVGPSGFVFTSGGIGPTHDDVTYEAISEALGCGMELHPGTVERMTAHYKTQGKEVNAARLRMATLPAGCEVLTTPNLWVPIAKINNIYILPGIPRLFNQMLEANKEHFSGPGMTLETLYTWKGEGDLADALREIAANHPGVTIGSYPRTTNAQEYTTKLCFEGRDPESVTAAIQDATSIIETFDIARH